MITAIVILVVVGILLVLLEFLVIPGTTYIGITGFLLISGSVFLAYYHYGTRVGHYFLLGTAAFIIVSTIIALRSGTWKKAMLQEEVSGIVEKFKENSISVGDTGITVSRLAPAGKILINNIYVEAEAHNQLINENTNIEVIKVSQNKIIVKPINT
ncbi:MAG: hypothetical protein C0594_16375 [Marinilabiliales bacterium]|nr:MAG: hypothetical protein C0594_16375 [Marinilabiliales bacterium]